MVGWHTATGTTAFRTNIDAQRFKVDANGPVFVDVAGNTVAAGMPTEFQVSTVEPADSLTVSVTGRADGGFVFTWADSIDDTLDNTAGNGFGYEILARTYTEAGVAGTAQIVNFVTTNQQITPDVASQEDGSSVVIFQALNHPGDGSLWGMYARKIDADGVPQGGADIQLNTTTLNIQAGGSIAALSDINNDGLINDGYIVVWTSATQNNTQEHIFGRRLDTDGNPVGNEFQIDINGGLLPSVVALSDGTFVVNWNAVTSTTTVVGRRFDAAGAVTPVPTTGEVPFSSLVNSGRGDDPFSPDLSPAYAGRDAMAFLTDGSLVAVWNQRDAFPSQDTDIMVRDFAVGLGTPNTAPVLDPDATPVLGNVPEGFTNHSGTPLGPMGTLISDLVDLNSSPGGLDNVTDPDAPAVTGVAITNLDTANGDWWYTTDGTNWKLIGAVSATAAFALAADANTRIFFAADLGFDGTHRRCHYVPCLGPIRRRQRRQSRYNHRRYERIFDRHR